MFTKMNEILSSRDPNEMALGSKSINVLMLRLVQQVRPSIWTKVCSFSSSGGVQMFSIVNH